MPELPALSRPSDLRAATDAAFAAEGPLARAVPSFEPREGQRRMAAAVADTLRDGGVLLAEAGTGTGKTLAYLVPAILSRQRVLVSTGTKNLQEQIYFKDLPVLRDALGVPFTATYMKGRANYLCLHRLDELRAAPDAPRDFVSMLDEWVRATETGDRAELDELPEESPLWQDVAATAETCLGANCPQYHDCFVTQMRQRAAAADLIIVNHHLLCADASVRQSAYGEVIPDCRCAVVDEAHQLEDVATQYFGIAVSNYRVDELVRDAERALNLGGLDDADGVLRRALIRADDDARRFFAGVSTLGRVGAADPMAEQNRPDLLAPERVRLRPGSYGNVRDAGLAAVAALDALAAALGARAGAEGPGAEVNEDAAALARRAGEIRDELRVLLEADDPGYVYFLEVRGRGVFLRAAPIDVSAIVREVLIDRRRAIVMTSATLAVDGSFAYARGRLGITEARELRVPSEFDYASQAVLYLPRRMPAPGAPDYARHVAREVMALLQCTRGRAFVLFTSYAMLRAVQALVEGRLPYPLLVQGTAPRRALLDRFRATPHAVLLATSSFWQGVDVAGEQLSAVIIDKLPFASPADPITAARIEALTADGRDAFQEYQVPLAILALQQGLGRLIRHRADRGVLALLDPRVRTRAYGERFLQACPPAPITDALDEVARFMARE